MSKHCEQFEESLEITGPRAARFGGGEAPRLLPGVRAHSSVLVQTAQEIDYYALRNATQANPQALVETCTDLARRRALSARARRSGYGSTDHEADGLSFGQVRDMPALRQLMDRVGQITVQVPDGRGGQRAIVTDSMALLTSSMAVADVNYGYESVPTISEFLIGEEIDDIQPNTEIGMPLDFGTGNATDVPVRVNEGELGYGEVGAGEERYTVLDFPQGFKRSFSQQFVDRAPAQVYNQLLQLGNHMRERVEMWSLVKATDHHGSASSGSHHVMVRQRATAALFSATANTPGTRAPSGTRITNNALVDSTDLDALRVRLASFRNERGYPIPVRNMILLVPDALWVTAWKILGAVFEPGVFNEPNFFGPQGPVRMTLLSSPYLDLLSTSAWYGGDPRRILVRKWALRPEVATYGGTGTQAFVDSRTALCVRLAWDMEVGVRDYVGWVQSLSDQTAPKDE